MESRRGQKRGGIGSDATSFAAFKKSEHAKSASPSIRSKHAKIVAASLSSPIYYIAILEFTECQVFGGSFPAVEAGVWRPEIWKEVHRMKRSVLKFRRDDSGATAIEYGLIAAAIALAIIAILNGIGLQLADMLASLNASLK